jgi:hypothetical protein
LFGSVGVYFLGYRYVFIILSDVRVILAVVIIFSLEGYIDRG